MHQELVMQSEKCNKLKKYLPSLPSDFTGDAHIYYYKTYNINLFDYKVRCQFDKTISISSMTT
ncbi:hypothetical protein RhiirC2_788934 [Rhizophagus irregularis]|uniref:Uncharacterized protein n=1 Tax=Rhizophagus irregularis TaxID=588596 RepID=A0A2N1MP45_9GLOM|nr:hypothetical protein RhiirC2_788934 [Rhizophagus irregularis]